MNGDDPMNDEDVDDPMDDGDDGDYNPSDNETFDNKHTDNNLLAEKSPNNMDEKSASNGVNKLKGKTKKGELNICIMMQHNSYY